MFPGTPVLVQYSSSVPPVFLQRGAMPSLPCLLLVLVILPNVRGQEERRVGQQYQDDSLLLPPFISTPTNQPQKDRKTNSKLENQPEHQSDLVPEEEETRVERESTDVSYKPSRHSLRHLGWQSVRGSNSPSLRYCCGPSGYCKPCRDQSETQRPGTPVYPAWIAQLYGK